MQGTPAEQNAYRNRGDLVQAATSCIAAARRLTMAHNMRLPTDQREIVGSFDAGRIDRDVGTNISNAITISLYGGDVAVRLWSGPVDAYVSIAELGIGVPISDRDAVFQSRKREGNGGSTPGRRAGLVGAAHLVELAGCGIINVKQVGRGPTLVVRPPIVAEDDGP